jgi:hypothetical protein
MNRAELFDLVVPHFTTRQMAMRRVGRSSLHESVCLMDDVRPGDKFDGVASISCFVFLGSGWFPRQVGAIRPWLNPHDRSAAA